MKGGHKSHHHGKKGGGRVGLVASGNPDVLKEAKGEEPYDKGDEKKKGGAVKRKDGGHVHGKATRHRMDRPKPGRKRGGGVGADRSPLSSAHASHGGGGKSPSSEDSYGGHPD
jgi:hypothetical protein